MSETILALNEFAVKIRRKGCQQNKMKIQGLENRLELRPSDRGMVSRYGAQTRERSRSATIH